MQNALKAEIKRLANRAFLKQQRAAETDQKYRDKFLKRTGVPAGLPVVKNENFKHKHFDPVYCSRNANFLAKTIWHKVCIEQYEPLPAINYQIKKPDGGKRSIMAFSLPDAALANVVLRRTRDRNLKRLSPASYAYHPEKNVFDAILSLREFDNGGKLFAVQIDFEKYFDTIPSKYLISRIDDAKKISLTPHERFIFKKFLCHRYASHEKYTEGNYARRIKGTPQGSSVSLLLANIANHDLDVTLSAEAGKFVRFADDVVALCQDYSQAQRLERCFIDHCNKSGLVLNQQKSPGIAIIAETPQEIRHYPNFDYLGYRFTANGLTIPQKVENRIKTRISRLVHIYLIKYLANGFAPKRCRVEHPSYDWDLLGLIYELRRSLYGGLSEDEINDFIYKGKKLRKMKGLMGFYCLIDNPEALKRIDGWILSTIRRGMTKRNEILNKKYNTCCPVPNNKQLAIGSWIHKDAWRGDEHPETRMPSLVRGWRAARKHYFTFGLQQVEAPGYMFYEDITKAFKY